LRGGIDLNHRLNIVLTHHRISRGSIDGGECTEHGLIAAAAGGYYQFSVKPAQEAAAAAEAAAAEAAAAEGMMQAALKSIFAVAEAYPDLKASENFLQLQAELVDTENKIQASRRFYNGGVREFNTMILVFPNNVWAKQLGFSMRDFFEVENPDAIAEPPKVQF
jgi:LemA protein